MPQQTIYVPDELKAEMDAAKDLNINWSQVAQEAFQHALRIEKVKLVSIEQGQLERLRASMGKSAEEYEAEGEGLGKEWALHQAEYDDLARVAELAVTVDVGAAGTARALAAAILDEEDPAHRDVWDTLGEIFGKVREGALLEAQAAGFINGAAEVFEEV